MNIKLRVLFYKKDEWWYAQSIEHDFSGFGATMEDAKYELERVLVAHVLSCFEHQIMDPFENVPPAPERFGRMFEEAEQKKSIPHQFQLPGGLKLPYELLGGMAEARL